MKALRLGVAGIGLSAAFLTGCSSSSSSPSSSPASSGPSSTAATGSSVITVHTTDALRFQPAAITVHGLTAKIKLVNDGSYPHNLMVPSLHFTSKTVSGDPGSQSTTFTLHFTKPGKYPFECTYHASAGMKGEFTVTK